MNDRPKPPSTQPVQFVINLSELSTVGCPTCGGFVFTTNVAMFKELTAIRSPTGKAQLIKVELCICQSCNTLVQPVGTELKVIETIIGTGKSGEA